MNEFSYRVRGMSNGQDNQRCRRCALLHAVRLL
jgi:hypothetical protein